MLFQMIAAVLGAWIAWMIAMRRAGFLFGLLAFVGGVIAATAFTFVVGLVLHDSFGAKPGPALMMSIQTFVLWGPLSGVIGIVIARRHRSAVSKEN